MAANIRSILNPEFVVLIHKNVVMIEQTRRNLCKEGWFPVGGIGEKKPEWVQVMVREMAIPVPVLKTSPVSVDDEEKSPVAEGSSEDE